MSAHWHASRLWIVCLSIVLVCGCNGDPATGPTPVTPRDTIERVASVAITIPPVRFIVGDSIRLTAVVLSRTGRVMDGQPVQWTSSDPSIAGVSEHGVVRGHNVGSANITARVGDRSSVVFLSVYPAACAQVATTIGIGETRTGFLSSCASLLLGEPADGWHFTVSAPALLQFDLKSSLYFAHLVLTDAQMRPVARAEYYTASASGLITLRSQLAAGSYIIWVGADGDDGGYQLSVNAVSSGS
jgi:hypothetical protein